MRGPHWRRVMAALANRDARNAYAQIVLREDVLPSVKEQRRSRAIAVLLEAGLAEWTGTKGLEASDAVFPELLSQQPSASRRRVWTASCASAASTGTRQPGGPARAPGLDRRADDPAGEDLSERQVNERLLNFADDVVLLRRYLVDFGLVERTASGSSYRRTESVLGTQD